MNVHIDETSREPKYKQLIKSIEKAILNGDYKRGDHLPSINSLRKRFGVSRDTVLLAYGNLKLRGIVYAIPGKGYYIKTENVSTKERIFLLFDEFNSFKEDLYNSFLKHLDKGVEVDIFFHHFNIAIFSKLIFDNIGVYNSYIIMPANLKGVHLILDKLPKESVYILDQTQKELSKYPSLTQNFKEDVVFGLTESYQQLKKYKKVVFVYLKEKQPKEMLKGFKKFCKTHKVKYEIISNIEEKKIAKDEAYLIPDDRTLIRLIKTIRDSKLIIAKDIGIISYNDTLLKEIVEDGITTISTDFKEMGQRLASMILNKEDIKIENVNKLIIRNSL
jgi:DNA-binding GntR family transcriptional regulator